VIGLTVLGIIFIGEVFKVETLGGHFCFGGFGFACGVQLFQNTAIALKDVIEITYYIITVTV
jgi:hypothetical protein